MKQRGYRVTFRKGSVKQSQIFVGMDDRTYKQAEKFASDMARQGCSVAFLPMFRSSLLEKVSQS